MKVLIFGDVNLKEGLADFAREQGRWGVFREEDRALIKHSFVEFCLLIAEVGAGKDVWVSGEHAGTCKDTGAEKDSCVLIHLN